MSGSLRGEPEATWIVKEHDEAKYNFSDEKGVWQPRPEDILSLFEKLAQGNPLPLKWTCPGRRHPDKDVKSEKNIADDMDDSGSDSWKEEHKAPEISAFDFDEPYVDVNAKLIPKRAPGGVGRTPKTEKRVARMDNIMKSLHKQQLQRAAEREARKAKGSPSSISSRPRLLNFGSNSPKNTTPGASAKLGPQVSSASSPRFGRGSTSFSPSSLLNKGPSFMTPTSAARKMTPQPNTTQISTAESKASDMSNLQASASTAAPQGSSFSLSESRSGQFITSIGQTDTGISLDDLSSVTAQPKIISTSSFNPINNSIARANMSTAVTPSNVTMISSAVTASNVSSTLDKEYVPATSISKIDSSHPVSSLSAQVVAPATPANPSVTSASETRPVHSTGASPAGLVDSGMSLEAPCLDAAVNDHLVSLTESVSLSGPSNADAQHADNVN
ncbi:hypothetical protein BsWGS_21769 [Bradybaena similaris]